MCDREFTLSKFNVLDCISCIPIVFFYSLDIRQQVKYLKNEVLCSVAIESRLHNIPLAVYISFWYKTNWPTPKWKLKITWPTPLIKHKNFQNLKLAVKRAATETTENEEDASSSEDEESNEEESNEKKFGKGKNAGDQSSSDQDSGERSIDENEERAELRKVEQQSVWNSTEMIFLAILIIVKVDGEKYIIASYSSCS